METGPVIGDEAIVGDRSGHWRRGNCWRQVRSLDTGLPGAMDEKDKSIFSCAMGQEEARRTGLRAVFGHLKLQNHEFATDGGNNLA